MRLLLVGVVIGVGIAFATSAVASHHSSTTRPECTQTTHAVRTCVLTYPTYFVEVPSLDLECQVRTTGDPLDVSCEQKEHGTAVHRRGQWKPHCVHQPLQHVVQLSGLLSLGQLPERLPHHSTRRV